jgi:hypothetical protein
MSKKRGTTPMAADAEQILALSTDRKSVHLSLDPE